MKNALAAMRTKYGRVMAEVSYYDEANNRAQRFSHTTSFCRSTKRKSVS